MKTCTHCNKTKQLIDFYVCKKNKDGRVSICKYCHILYTAWRHMKARCHNKNHQNYHRYGGRGITVCDEWQSYLKFKEWALNNDWKKGLELDRIDNNGNYEPSNCQFTTHIKQMRNREVITLNEDLVVEIRQHLKDNILYQREIAKLYNVNTSTISNINTSRYWK